LNGSEILDQPITKDTKLFLVNPGTLGELVAKSFGDIRYPYYADGIQGSFLIAAFSGDHEWTLRFAD